MNVNKFNRLQFEAALNMLNETNCKPWNFVFSPTLIENNFLEGFISELPIGKVLVLNLYPDACEEFTLHETGFSCNMRFRGTPVHINLPYSAILGYYHPNLADRGCFIPLVTFSVGEAIAMPSIEARNDNVITVDFSKKKEKTK